MKAVKNLNVYFDSFYICIRQFLMVLPWVFVLGCVSQALSRIAQVIAFFLPLKIFIIIHYAEIPSYFNVTASEGLDFNSWIALLIFLVPLCYLSFIFLGVVYRLMIDRHMKAFEGRVLIFSEKSVSGERMVKLHNHMSKAFSEFALFGIAIIVTAVLNLALAVFLIILLYLNLLLFYNKALNVGDKERLTLFKLHRRQFIEYISSANFLLVFFVLAIELIYFSMGVYTAIFLLFLSRMLFQALNRFSVESLFILKHLPVKMEY